MLWTHLGNFKFLVCTDIDTEMMKLFVILSRSITKMKNAVNWKTIFPNTHILHIFCCTEKNHGKNLLKKRMLRLKSFYLMSEAKSHKKWHSIENRETRFLGQVLTFTGLNYMTSVNFFFMFWDRMLDTNNYMYPDYYKDTVKMIRKALWK